jgi:hypothetical protein
MPPLARLAHGINHRRAMPPFGKNTIDVPPITKPTISQVHASDLRGTET